MKRADARKEYLAYLRLKAEEQREYHDHKERSAWGTTAAYIAASGFVFLGADDVKVDDFWVACCLVGLLSLGFVSGAALILWQLRNRRNSNLQSSAWLELMKQEIHLATDGTDFTDRFPERRPKGRTEPDYHAELKTQINKNSPPIWGPFFVYLLVVITGVPTVLRMFGLLEARRDGKLYFVLATAALVIIIGVFLFIKAVKSSRIDLPSRDEFREQSRSGGALCHYCQKKIKWVYPKLYRDSGGGGITFVCSDKACIEKAKTGRARGSWEEWPR